MSDLIDRNLIAELVDSHGNVRWEDIAGLPSEQHEVRTQISSADCISRRAAIDAIANCTNCGDEKTLRAYVAKHNLDNGWTGGVLEAIDAIEDLPSAKPEIIRCRDCKHYYYADNRVPQEQRYVCDLDFCRWNPDDYCSYAERREE